MDEPRERPVEAPDEASEPIEDLLARHLSSLRAYVRLRMGPELRARESASDLVQSTCREILQHRERYRHPGSEGFRRWLFTTALRKVQNRLAYHRALKRDVALEARAAGSAGDEALAAFYQSLSTPSRLLAQRERIEELERAFDKLSDPHRRVILLSRMMGLSHEEVAREMKRSMQATRSLLHRALAELAEGLSD